MKQQYTGGCQCGAVRYSVEADLENIIECNCSRCGRYGFILAFVESSDFVLEKGEDSLTEYLFNKHAIQHLFCKVCGVESFARGIGEPTVAINIRCLEGVDIQSLKPVFVNGREM